MAFAKVGNVAYDRRVTYNNPACRSVLVWRHLESASLLVVSEPIIANDTTCGAGVVYPVTVDFISVKTLKRDGCATGLIIIATFDRQRQS